MKSWAIKKETKYLGGSGSPPPRKKPSGKNLTSFIACFRKDKKPTGKNLNKIQLAHTYKQYVAHSQQQQQQKKMLA